MTNGFSILNLFGPESAGLQGNLVTAQSLLSSVSSSVTYDLYKQQEQQYIQNALVMAKRQKAAGEVELRNLEYTHTQQLGKAINTVAGAGGNLSGSALDVIMQKKRFAIMDESMVQINVSNAAHEVVREGFLNAANVAMQAKARAEADRFSAVGSMLRGFQKYFNVSNKTAAETERQRVITEETNKQYNMLQEDLLSQFPRKPYGSDSLLNEAFIDQEKQTSELSIDKHKPNSGLIGDFSADTLSINSGGNNLWA